MTKTNSTKNMNKQTSFEKIVSYVGTLYARRCRGEIGKTADFVRRNIADMQKSFE